MFFKTRVKRRRRPAAKYLTYKEKAREMIRERLLYYNTFYNFSYKRIAIKDHRSRWGSCSKKGNLNFNYRLVLLPQHLADYVIVHELCHLGEFNHSPRFWALVEKTVPDWKERRRELMKINVDFANL
jgi:predicted metal-dependent hydrolase